MLFQIRRFLKFAESLLRQLKLLPTNNCLTVNNGLLVRSTVHFPITMAVRFSELPESNFSCLFEQKVIVMNNEQKVIALLYRGSAYISRFSPF